MEIWKKIDGYDNYEVSNLGRVKSLDRTIVYSDGRSYNYKSQVLKPIKNKDGYLLVNLYKNGKMKTHYIHRLVYETFKGPIPEGMQCNHISENKTENNLENLNLMSPKENCNWGTRNERNAKARTNGKKSKPVLQLDLEGNIIREYPSANEVQRQTGYSNGNISKCCIGKYKTAYNYKWKYKEVS